MFSCHRSRMPASIETSFELVVCQLPGNLIRRISLSASRFSRTSMRYELAGPAGQRQAFQAGSKVHPVLEMPNPPESHERVTFRSRPERSDRIATGRFGYLPCEYKLHYYPTTQQMLLMRELQQTKQKTRMDEI